MKKQKFIFITFQKEGTHCYPDAPKEVSFLRNEHRHMFHFRVELEIFHDDRDIEFIMFKRELEGLYNDDILNLDHKSCEMMAEELHNYIVEIYEERDLIITISEDGENGAVCYYPAIKEQIPRLYEGN